ncbi:MAG: hypothetical protein K2G36_06995 [Ruminococcus sp.]|nr:hypothetical protein [Ruminococcus sp.]
MNIGKIVLAASKFTLPVPVEIILMVIAYAIKLILEKNTPAQAISAAASKFSMDEKTVSQIFNTFVK